MQTWSSVLASIPPEILYRLQCHSPHYHECEYKETKLGCPSALWWITDSIPESWPPALQSWVQTYMQCLTVLRSQWMEWTEKVPSLTSVSSIIKICLHVCSSYEIQEDRTGDSLWQCLRREESLQFSYCRLLVSLDLVWTVFERMHQISIDCCHYHHNPYCPDINLC